MKRKLHVILEPNMKLGEYTKHLESPSFNWITFLSVSHITCSRTDLIKICDLANLGVLTIGEKVHAPDIGLDDSVIRSWGRIAANSDKFSSLRVLNCRAQRGVTPKVFEHLNQFPALSSFNVEEW